MTIQLPKDMESTIEAAVLSGWYTSVDAAMTRAAQLLIREIERTQAPAPGADESQPDPLLGCMRDDAELMDEIVAEAYRQRGADKWREIDL